MAKLKTNTNQSPKFTGLMRLRIKLLQKFIRVNPKQIMFMANDGQSFSDSPRTAFELLKTDPAYKDFTFVWAFNDPSEFSDASLTKKVAMRSFGYLRHLLRSKYWITNSSIDRYVAFKHDHNVYIQVGVGVPLQHLGQQNPEASKTEKKWVDNVRFDYLFTYSEFDTNVMTEVFPMSDRYNQVGQLRKYALAKMHDELNVNQTKIALHLNPNKKTMLYMASDRPTNMNEEHLPFLGHECLTELAKSYNILYRGAGVSEAVLAVPGVINANNLDVNETFVLSDLLVTDYDNSLFDFAVEHKPIYLYQSDVAEYSDARGLYISSEELGLPVVKNEKELLHKLMGDVTADIAGVEDIVTYYNPLPAEQAVDFLFEIIPAID